MNEYGRLADRVGGQVKGTKTIRFIRKRDLPKERRKDVTYGQLVCTERDKKAERLQSRFLFGGNRTNYTDEVATPTTGMIVAKIIFNSVVSTKGARFMTMDISNFYLDTPLKPPEYLRIKLSDIPLEIVQEYKLKDIATQDGYVYVEATEGIYGLPQAGLLANKLLEKRLNKHGYFQSKFVPGLWMHKWQPITFTLVVNNFGVKYVGKEHAEHLREVIKKYYPVTEDWTGKRYIGITLDWIT